MKILRIWLLVLLAALLPVRGAMAAAVLCSPSGVDTQNETRLMDGRAVGHEHDAEAHVHAGHHHTKGQEHDHGASGHDKCNMCSAFCSVTPLLSATPQLPQPHELAAAPFPVLSVPAPSFLSDGQERPPRSI